MNFLHCCQYFAIRYGMNMKTFRKSYKNSICLNKNHFHRNNLKTSHKKLKFGWLSQFNEKKYFFLRLAYMSMSGIYGFTIFACLFGQCF